MNSTITTNYYSYSAPTLKQRLLGLLSQIDTPRRVVSLSIFGASSNETYHSELAEFKNHIRAHLGYLPLTTYIIQPLPDTDGMALEVQSFTLGGDVEEFPTVETPDNVRYIPINISGRELFLVEGIYSDSFTKSMSEQSADIFTKITRLLKSLDLTPSNIIRQWNYIGNITAMDDTIQHYQAFNDARSEFYATDSWDMGYPAATGIGTSCDGLVVSFIACRGCKACSRAINNPLQIAAHAYTKRVLIGEDVAPKSTPKFERAKSLVLPEGRSCCFISGTAAIRGEDSLQEADAAKQTLQTIENIEYLISDENMVTHNSTARSLQIVAMRVYVKQRADFDSVRRVVESRLGSTPAIYVEADVCRSELLVEIEGIAKGGVI